jgi:signal transduction histidine kinase
VKKSRTLYAAVLLVGVLAAPLVAWFFSGWADVRAQQRELRAEPTRAAQAKASGLASELRQELTRLLAREAERPYFHYQNLFHDPRTGPSYYVSTSPLATGPQDQLILGYFNDGADGKLTTPTINDEAPHLSDQTRLAENRRFLDEVRRGFADQLAPVQGEIVAEAVSLPVKKKRIAPPQPQYKSTSSEDVTKDTDNAGAQEQQKAQVVQIDQQSYVQNNASNRVYWDNYLGNNPKTSFGNLEREQKVQQQQKQLDQHEQLQLNQQLEEERAKEAQAKEQAQLQQGQQAQLKTKPKPVTDVSRGWGGDQTEPKSSVTITISPFDWHTYPYAGQPALIAVRHVKTPDGTLSQGFVVDRSTLTSWLASRAGDSVAELVVGDEGGPNEIAPGWQLTVGANPRTLVDSAATAAKVASAFLMRFVIIGVIAAIAAMLVLMMVARAEQLARERSQFAAAAAHELRTPLAGLQLYGDMLADGLGDPTKLRDYARRMSEEASRLGRVVSNVLGFSQLERGNLAVDAKPGPLGGVLKELAERAEPALDRAGAMLALDVSPDLRARFDRDALIRVVGNLLDNAEKYGRAAEDRTIELAAREIDDTVEVTVRDHGPGISAEARAKLFRAFSRGVDADGPAGLGLGLALSKSLAHAMGGELAYRDGEGATFVLRLPKA